MKKEGNLHGTFYTYSVVTADGEREDCDPYAKAVGVNGERAMVVDLDSTDPEGWEMDKSPFQNKNVTDAVIYEAHIRDLTVHKDSGIENKGKFLGLAEEGTVNSRGDSTGLDHIADLGVTHVHLLPFFDYASVDETKDGQYNWGYDPENFFVPEGSYATDPYNGEIRIREAKKWLQHSIKKELAWSWMLFLTMFMMQRNFVLTILFQDIFPGLTMMGFTVMVQSAETIQQASDPW